jgi:hypothetical protein
MAANMGLIKTTYNAKCFVGHIPPLQAGRAIKFRTAQAMLKAEIKKAARKLHTLLSKRKMMNIPEKMTWIHPGLPKPMLSA